MGGWGWTRFKTLRAFVIPHLSSCDRHVKPHPGHFYCEQNDSVACLFVCHHHFKAKRVFIRVKAELGGTLQTSLNGQKHKWKSRRKQQKAVRADKTTWFAYIY